MNFQSIFESFHEETKCCHLLFENDSSQRDSDEYASHPPSMLFFYLLIRFNEIYVTFQWTSIESKRSLIDHRICIDFLPFFLFWINDHHTSLFSYVSWGRMLNITSFILTFQSLSIDWFWSLAIFLLFFCCADCLEKSKISSCLQICHDKQHLYLLHIVVFFLIFKMKKKSTCETLNKMKTTPPIFISMFLSFSLATALNG